MSRGVGGHSPANVQRYLQGVHYPARKEKLIQTAERNHAPNEVFEELRNLPEAEFGGPQEVMKAYGKRH